MKNLLKDESGVSYLLIMLFIILVIVGIGFSFLSDFLDLSLSSINDFAGTPLEGQMDQDSIDGGYFLRAIFRYSLVPILLIIMLWMWNMAQKPVKPY